MSNEEEVNKILDRMVAKCKKADEEMQRKLELLVAEARAANIPEEQIRKVIYSVDDPRDRHMKNKIFAEVLDK